MAGGEMTEKVAENKPFTLVLGAASCNFNYGADGTKLSKRVKTGGAINLVIVKDPASNILSIGKYVNGVEYPGTAIPATILEAVYLSEGRMHNRGGTSKREYILGGQLGNTLIAFCDFNGNGVIAAPGQILQEIKFDA
ncbi:MAG TPA: hypothetical protein PKM27_14360 [Saprospiraceae bacterium]|nr:hypothetical protein [Saprospiraceae bacterium]HNT22138.1 hypothetical protein [Saprospiraceae bacterium]